jgi:hypothetical protein
MWNYDRRQLEEAKPLSKKGGEDLKLALWALFLVFVAAILALVK